MYLHPPRHPPHRRTLPSVSGGAHITCHVRSPGLSLPPFLSYRLCFFSGFSASVFTFHASPPLTRRLPLSLFIGHPSFGNVLFSFEFKPGSGLRHCGSLKFAQSAQTTAEEVERGIKMYWAKHKHMKEGETEANEMKSKRKWEIAVAFATAGRQERSRKCWRKCCVSNCLTALSELFFTVYVCPVLVLCLCDSQHICVCKNRWFWACKTSTLTYHLIVS